MMDRKTFWEEIPELVNMFVNLFFKNNYQKDDWGFADREDIKSELLYHFTKLESRKAIKYPCPKNFVKVACWRRTCNLVVQFNLKSKNENKSWSRNPQKNNFISELNSGETLPAPTEIDYNIGEKFLDSLDEDDRMIITNYIPYRVKINGENTRKRQNMLRKRRKIINKFKEEMINNGKQQPSYIS